MRLNWASVTMNGAAVAGCTSVKTPSSATIRAAARVPGMGTNSSEHLRAHCALPLSRWQACTPSTRVGLYLLGTGTVGARDDLQVVAVGVVPVDAPAAVV